MTLRDELKRAFAKVEKRPIVDEEMSPDNWHTLYADACLALLRSRIPGFDALVEGEAVVVPVSATSSMRLVLLDEMAEDVGPQNVWDDLLAASPYAQREAK